jgi:hypothetical protein
VSHPYRYARILILAFLVCVAGAPAAYALAGRTWVSGTGSDANSCSRSAPCLTFSHALSQTAAGGELDVLDPGDFGPVTISQAVSIVGAGAVGGIQVTSGNAITITAGSSDIIVLRGLALDGRSTTSGSGIVFTSGGLLHVESCTINNFGGYGIDIEPSSTSEKVFILDTIIRNNGSGVTGGGIFIQPTSSAVVTAIVDSTRMENGVFGLKAVDNVDVTIRNSIASHNGFSGFSMVSTGGGVPLMFIENSAATYNGTNGLNASGHLSPLQIMRISNVVLTGNATGMGAGNGASIVSFSNNKNDGNTSSNGSPTSTVAQQ